MIEALRNWFHLDVFDQFGQAIEPGLDMINVPLLHLYPNKYVCMIDWKDADGQLPDEEEIKEPLLCTGSDGVTRTIHAGWYWGSSGIKEGRTYGVESDFWVDDGPLTHVERSLMFGRALINSGQFGALRGSFRILVVPQGVVIDGHPIADGHGLIRRSLAELGEQEKQPKVQMGPKGGRAKSPTQFWPRIDWTPQLAAEVMPVLEDTLNAMIEGDSGSERKAASLEERRSLEELHPDMGLHPYVARSLERNAADAYYRAATTVCIPFYGYVAVPSMLTETIATDADLAGIRFPADSPTSVQAIEGQEGLEAELKRIDQLEVIQYTISSKELMAKGCVGIVETLPQGADIVLCVEDIKLGSRRKGIRRASIAMAFNLWFDKGSCMGLNPEWAKKAQGADFDGDMEFVTYTKERPVLHAQCKALGATKMGSVKLNKTRTLIKKKDKRAEFAAGCMRLGLFVGGATNLMFATYALKDRLRSARSMGFKSVAQMDITLNRLVKIGTDGFKTMEWSRAVNKLLTFETFGEDADWLNKFYGAMRGSLGRELGRMPPWFGWPNAWAFTRDVPRFWEDWMREDENHFKNAVPQAWDGTVVQILRLTLPHMEDHVGNLYKVLPLSHFREWAPIVDRMDFELALDLQRQYNARVHRVNFQVYDDVQNFVHWWSLHFQQWKAAQELTDHEATAALWRAAHSSRSNDASAASVFMADAEGVKWIIEEQPGLDVNNIQTLLLGLDYQFDTVPEVFTAEVDVRAFTQIVKGRPVGRKIVCGEVPGKKGAKRPYPADLIGFVGKGAIQPAEGKYLAQVVKVGRGNAWHCKLSALKEAVSS